MAVVWGATLGLKRQLLNMVGTAACNSSFMSAHFFFMVYFVRQRTRHPFLRVTCNSELPPPYLPFKVNDDEITQLRNAFRSVSGDGKVTSDQFESVMSNLGYTDLPLPRIFQLFDEDGNGTVEYKEFVCGLSTLRKVKFFDK